MNDVVPTTTPTVSLPRGSWYLLEGICQNPTPWTTTVLTMRAARLWSKLHKANPARVGEYNFEKRLPREDGESEGAFLARAEKSADAYETWQKELLPLSINAKEKTAIEKGISWALKNRDKVWPQNNDYILAILNAFDAGADDEDDAESA